MRIPERPNLHLSGGGKIEEKVNTCQHKKNKASDTGNCHVPGRIASHWTGGRIQEQRNAQQIGKSKENPSPGTVLVADILFIIHTGIKSANRDASGFIALFTFLVTFKIPVICTAMEAIFHCHSDPFLPQAKYTPPAGKRTQLISFTRQQAT